MLTLWTSDPCLAQHAMRAGIQRIGVDLERLGKAERQRGLGTWISPHTEGDLLRVGQVLHDAQLFARVNPVNSDSTREIETVLTAGAQVLMLPMVTSPHEAAKFVDLVAGRAVVVLLIERREALDRLSELIEVDGVDEVHVGLNDLALSLGFPNRWLVLADDLVANAGALVRAAGLGFGLGGIGRVGDESLPIPADLVYAECVRTGATGALVSRSFHTRTDSDLVAEVKHARSRLTHWYAASPAELVAAHTELGCRARQAADW